MFEVTLWLHKIEHIRSFTDNGNAIGITDETGSRFTIYLFHTGKEEKDYVEKIDDLVTALQKMKEKALSYAD